MTHYIPYFCRRRTNGEQMAVCGVWLKPWLASKAHSPEPSCPACQAWITEDADARAREQDAEVLQGLADRGCDTWEEYRNER